MISSWFRDYGSVESQVSLRNKEQRLDTYARVFLTEAKNGYAVNSGVQALVDDNLTMELDVFGNYQAIRKDPDLKTSRFDHELSLVSAMADESPDESVIAQDLFAAIPEIKFEPIIGYYLGLYAGYVVEQDYRAQGSSGGLTTWLLVQLLESGHIDGVVHVKPGGSASAVLFEYAISRSSEEIREGAKSRYYPAEFSGPVGEILRLGGKYAITGIPSFITEIRLLSKLRPEVAEALPYTFGLICGHQKSTKYAEAMAWQCGIQPGDLVSIDFRKKDPDAPASKYLTEIHGRVDGQMISIEKTHSEFFVSNWSHGFFKPGMSDYTDDALNETADVALGDAWLPQYVGDSRGTNVMIVRNPVIQEIIAQGVKSGLVYVENLSTEEILRSQRGLVHHTQDEMGYRLHKKDVQGIWRPQKRIAASNDLPFLRKRVQDVREEIATTSHEAYLEAVHMGSWDHFVATMSPKVRRHAFLYKLVLLRRNSPLSIVRKSLRLAYRKLPLGR